MTEPGYKLEDIPCPLCGTWERRHWGNENGFQCKKCLSCGLVYVSPRPGLEEISAASKIGEHKTSTEPLNVVNSRSVRKARRYSKILRSLFSDVVASTKPIAWLDVGAGYGEFVEGLQELLPTGSRVVGIEPMAAKVEVARRLNLPVFQKEVEALDEKFDVISLINVFSHVPNFREFLQLLRSKLHNGGEMFIETGNGGDLPSMKEYPDLLCLPDHLVFAGEQHVKRFLTEAGLSIVSTRSDRLDTMAWCGKNVVKKLLGRRVKLTVPYTSPFRRIFVRARQAASHY